MKRRQLLAAMGVSALAPAFAATKRYRIYMATWRGMTDVEKGFQEYLAKRGLSVDYIWRDAGQDRAKLAVFAREIEEIKPDLVYAWGTSATLGLVGTFDKPTKLSAPVVFALVAQPVAAKIVPRLKDQERDVTGVYHVAPIAAQLEAMRAYLPFAKVGTIYNREEQNSVVIIEELRRELQARKQKLLEATFAADSAGRPTLEGMDQRIAELRAGGAQWLYLGPDSYLFTQIDRVAAAALREKLPTFATTEALLESRAPVLTGLVSRYRAVGEFAAYKAEQILVAGKLAREVPVETLTRFSYMVRVDVATALGVLPPITLFSFAEFR